MFIQCYVFLLLFLLASQRLNKWVQFYISGKSTSDDISYTKSGFFLLSVVCMCSKQPPVVLHHHFHGWMHQARWCSTFYIIREITSYNMWLFLYLSITETKSVIDGLKVLPFGVY